MSGLARAFRRASVPLAAYYAVTLGLPVANGAARSGTVFVKHALVVLLVPLLAVALGSAIHAIYARSAQPKRDELSQVPDVKPAVGKRCASDRSYAIW